RQQHLVTIRHQSFVTMRCARPRSPVISHPVGSPSLKTALINGFEHREQNCICLFAAAQLIESSQGIVSEIRRGAAVMIELKRVRTVFFFRAAPELTMVH